MNEILFFLEILLLLRSTFWVFRLGNSALSCWVVVQALIANLFVLKQINLFGFDVTASDVFAIGSLLGLNFLQEYFGKKEAAKTTWICFFFMAFFAVVSQFHLLYEPNSFDSSHAAFESILSISPRLFVASMGTFFIVQRIDIYLFAFLRQLLPNVSFAVRAGISLVITQFIDTFLFSFAGLYGVVASVFDIILFSYLIKLIVVFCFTTCVRIAKS